VVSVKVPDLGNARRNQAIDALIAEYGRHVTRLATLLKTEAGAFERPPKRRKSE